MRKKFSIDYPDVGPLEDILFDAFTSYKDKEEIKDLKYVKYLIPSPLYYLSLGLKSSHHSIRSLYLAYFTKCKRSVNHRK